MILSNPSNMGTYFIKTTASSFRKPVSSSFTVIFHRRRVAYEARKMHHKPLLH
jgi:hypothetical protein